MNKWVNICRTGFFWPAKFIHQNLVNAFILTGAKQDRMQGCGFFVCELFASKLTIGSSAAVRLCWSRLQ